MEFNPDKCEVTHFTMLNQSSTFTDNGRDLGSTVEQRPWECNCILSLEMVIQDDEEGI